MPDKQSELRARRQRMMLEEPMMKVIPYVAIPMIISTLIDAIYNLADTFFVSGLGEVATAAVSVNDSLMNMLRAVAMGFAMGAASYISRLMGAKEDKKASRVATSTLGIGVIFSLLVGIICFFFREQIVMFMGSTVQAKSYSMDYAKWITLSAPFTTANLIMNQLLRSEGSTTYAMWGMCSGCILNCGLDPIFINTLGMEVEGAALATGISKAASCVVLAIPYIKHTAMLEIHPRNFKIEKDSFIEVTRMGVPAFIRMSLMSLGGIVTNNVAKAFGTAVLAAIAIANKLYRMIGSIIMGFSQGFGPVAGFCWGARRYNRVREAYRSTLTIGFVAAAILGVLMFVFARPLINIFNSEGTEQVTSIGMLKIRTLCVVFIPHVFVMVTSNLYQSLGKPLGNLILSMSRQLLFLIPLLLIVPKIFGVEGLACCQALSDLFSCLFLAIPFSASITKTIRSLKDGEDPPFGKASRSIQTEE